MLFYCFNQLPGAQMAAHLSHKEVHHAKLLEAPAAVRKLAGGQSQKNLQYVRFDSLNWTSQTGRSTLQLGPEP